MVIQFRFFMLVHISVLYHLVDSQLIRICDVVSIRELALESDSRVYQEFDLLPQLVVQEEVNLRDVMFNHFFIFPCHFEVIIVAFVAVVLLKLEFFKFLIDFVSPVLS